MRRARIFALPPWTVRAAQTVVAMMLLALIWRAADGPAAARALAGAEVFWLALAFMALTTQTFLSALRWRLTARRLGISLPVRSAIAEYYLSQVVNQSLPGGMVGDASRAVRSRRQAGLLAASQAVIFERIAGQIALFCVLAVAFSATLLVPGGLDWPDPLADAIALALVCIAFVPPLIWGFGHLPGHAGRGVIRITRAFAHAVFSPSVLPAQIMLSLGTTVANLTAFAFCARAVGVELSVAAVAALVPLILLTMLIPITVSGWGLREGAAAALLPLSGATASASFAASVAFGLAVIVAVLPGLVLLWWMPDQGWQAEPSPLRPDGTIRRGSAACFSQEAS